MFGIRIGYSGLIAQRQGLETTGHNIANASTKGYSRQRVRIEAISGATVPAVFSRWEQGGGGARVIDIDRIRDAFLETRSHTETGVNSYLKTQATVLGRIEQSFAEPGVNGMQAQLAELWGSFDDLANRPTDSSTRTALLQRAQNVVSAYNQVRGDMVEQRDGIGDQILTRISQVNDIAARIAELNDSIKTAINSGYKPNDLLDQRDLLISDLSTYVDVRTQYDDDGQATVFIGPGTLVREDRSYPIEATLVGDVYDVEYVNQNVDVDIAAGELGGLLEAFNTQLRVFNPPGPSNQASFMDRLYDVGTSLISTVNAIHTASFDLTGAAGLAFFQFDVSNNLQLNPTIAADADRIAAASAATNLADGEGARAIADLANSNTGADTVYREMITTLGLDVQRRNTQLSIQDEILQQVELSRSGEAGVNLDEEMTNLIMYQRAYDASARFVTAMDEALSTIISGLGLVGR